MDRYGFELALAFSLGDRGDNDAAVYATTGGVGGAAIVAFDVWPYWLGCTGGEIPITGVIIIGLGNSTDGDFSKWVKTRLWGGSRVRFLGWYLGIIGRILKQGKEDYADKRLEACIK